MVEPTTITPTPDPFGLDYESLMEEGVALVQALSGAIWTDYNAHDPGVTTLQQLCYALTELGYRAEFSIPDLLAPRDPTEFDPGRHNLYGASEIFPVNPVTIGDYRKLLVDRVESIRNVWLEPKSVDGIDGFYDIILYTPGVHACEVDDDGRPVEPAVRAREVYMAHRGLCEDLHAIVTAEELRTAVRATVEIAADVDADLMLAQVWFAIASFLAPELSRRSLEQSLADQSASELFTGPLLLNGFIPDDELQPKHCKVPVRAIGSAIAAVTGVVGVRRVAASVEGRPYGPRDTIEITKTQVLKFTPTRAGSGARAAFTVRLTRDGAAVSTDPVRVERLYAQLWDLHRMDYPLSEQYPQLLGFPTGEHRDLARYTSIQTQYPETYGITAFGLPPDATSARRGQAKQLKGYLLAFEQLLTDYFAQLAFVRELYSTDTLDRTYEFQSLCPAVPDVEPVLDGGCSPNSAYLRGLARLVASQDPVVERRNQQMSFLLALDAEHLDSGSIFDLRCQGADVDLRERVLAAKLALLRVIVPCTRDRGRGFDYERAPSPENMAGMALKCRVQLEMNPRASPTLLSLLDELGAGIVAAGTTPTLGRVLGRHAEHVDDSFAPVPEVEDRADDDDRFGPGSEDVGWLRGQTISPEFISAASETSNFRFGRLRGDETVALVCTMPASERWHFVARYPDADSACAGARAIARTARMLRRRSEQLFIIEHILLRRARLATLQSPVFELDQLDQLEHAPDQLEHAPDQALDLPANQSGAEADDLDFEYSFTITAVVATCSALVDDPDYRRFATEVIRQNTPAHIVSDVCFLDPSALPVFEEIYWAWRMALYEGGPGLAAASRKLATFLSECRTCGTGGNGEDPC